MPSRRLTVDAVLKMAHEQARRHAAMAPSGQAASPAMRQAIGQVWALVKGRLGTSDEVMALDGLIGRITATPRDEREASGV